MQGQPLSGALVSVAGGSESTATDAQGRFSFSATVPDSFSLSVQNQGEVAEIRVEDVPADSEVVTVEASIDYNTDTVAATSLSSSVKVEGECARYASVNGNLIKLALPQSVSECELAYTFHGANTLGAPSIDISSSSCRNLSSRMLGSNLNGSKMLIYEGLTVGRLSAACAAALRIRFSNSSSETTYNLRLAPAAGAVDTKVHATYQGNLYLTGKSSAAELCERFTAEQTWLVFSINGNSLAAEIPQEGLSLDGRVINGQYNLRKRFPDGAALSIVLTQELNQQEASFMLLYIGSSPNYF
jgi:hypothetical protein